VHYSICSPKYHYVFIGSFQPQVRQPPLPMPNKRDAAQ
jgi:hypothetical protein